MEVLRNRQRSRFKATAKDDLIVQFCLIRNSSIDTGGARLISPPLKRLNQRCKQSSATPKPSQVCTPGQSPRPNSNSLQFTNHAGEACVLLYLPDHVLSPL